MALSRDKLKALIRLANNNPNDNEANLAARKVCQQLHGEFALDDLEHSRNRTAAGKMNESVLKEWVDPRTGDLNIKITNLDLHNSENNKIINILKLLKQEITRPRTWNDVRRSTEPQWRTKPPDPKPPYTTSEYDTYTGPYDDIFKEMFERMKRDAAEAKRNEEKRQQHASNYSRPGGPFSGGQRGGKSNPWSNEFWEGMPKQDAPEPESYDRETTPHFKWRVDPATGKKTAYQETYESNMNPDGPKPKKPQALRKCVKCGLEIMTYRINENPWKCQWCHWGKEKT